MDEAIWERLSQERLGDIELLLNNGRWSAAYYLAGYAVECRLKACIVTSVQKDPGVLFRVPNLSKEVWTHDLSKLLTHAGLLDKKNEEIKMNNRFATNWLLVSKWTETTRYDLKGESEARDFSTAIIEPKDGLIAWIDRNS